MKTIDIQIVFAPSFPLHTEHSDAKLWHIGCSPRGFIGYRQTEFWTSFTSL